MLSSSVNNTAAAGSSNPRHYHHHHHLEVSSCPDVFSDHNSSICGSLLHHHTNLVPGIVAQDAHDHVPIERTITFITPFGNTTSMDMPRSVARVTKKKSDKRSKIRTAQGLRDRRVRLSTGIARKFFDLQDLLGFDKPSKTVDWLLTKSSKAILDLSAASSSSISSEAAGAEDGFKSLSSSRSTTNQSQQVSCDDTLHTMNQKAALLARESRERARARARARTVAKMCTSKLDQQKIRLLSNPGVKNGDHQTSYFSSNCHSLSSPSFLKASYAERQEEKRKGSTEQPKQKQQLQLHSYGPNPNLSLDWDISSVIPQPSPTATHRLNLSRDIEIYTRSSWDQLLNNYETL